MAEAVPARKGSLGLVFGANTGQAGASFYTAKGPQATFSKEQPLGVMGPPHRGARGSREELTRGETAAGTCTAKSRRG